MPDIPSGLTEGFQETLSGLGSLQLVGCSSIVGFMGGGSSRQGPFLNEPMQDLDPILMGGGREATKATSKPSQA